VKHSASSSFWAAYHALPESVRRLADKSFALLKQNPAHPSVHLKSVGRYCSARVGLHHRALGVPLPDGIVWFWIGAHDEYERIIRR
jgi:hypothetical protein